MINLSHQNKRGQNNFSEIHSNSNLWQKMCYHRTVTFHVNIFFFIICRI